MQHKQPSTLCLCFRPDWNPTITTSTARYHHKLCFVFTNDDHVTMTRYCYRLSATYFNSLAITYIRRHSVLRTLSHVSFVRTIAALTCSCLCLYLLHNMSRTLLVHHKSIKTQTLLYSTYLWGTAIKVERRFLVVYNTRKYLMVFKSLCWTRIPSRLGQTFIKNWETVKALCV